MYILGNEFNILYTELFQGGKLILISIYHVQPLIRSFGGFDLLKPSPTVQRQSITYMKRLLNTTGIVKASVISESI
jgi:hypothetical protein